MDWTTVGVYALVGLALLVLLWPTATSGRRLLRRWGVAEPDEQQSALAVRYLRDRRMLYPVLFLLMPLVVPAEWGADLFVPVVMALLLAEAVGALRPARGPRVASLTPRRWPDLVQRWAVGFMVTLGVLALVMAIAGAMLQPWVDRVISAISPDNTWHSPDGTVHTLGEEARLRQSEWPLVVIGVAVGVVAVLGLVWLAVRRPSLPDAQVDAALRTRTARVAVGIGIAWMASTVVLANARLQFLQNVDTPEPPPAWLEALPFNGLSGFIVLFVGAAGWYWVANPANRMPYVQSAK